MSSYPAPRDIPAGKILITPFGMPAAEIIPDMAVVEKITEAFAAHVAIRATVRLEWSSPGWELAGSACRWTNGYFACRWTDRRGCTQGRRFLNTPEGEAEARAHFAKITAPETVGA